MRIALVDGSRTLASPGLKAICPACKAPVTARCGDIRVHHWAHLGERSCDHWWEPRTPWHLGWQDRFPLDWQEVIRPGPSGKWHIADVHTVHGLTLEFQWSHLSAAKIAEREAFHGNMVWVVAGARLRGDLPRLKSADLQPIFEDEVFLVRHPGEVFNRNWTACSKPVFFDFAGFKALLSDTQRLIEPLWCLLPDRANDEALVVKVPREAFVAVAQNGADSLPAHLARVLEIARSAMEQQRARAAATERMLLSWWLRQSRRRARF